MIKVVLTNEILKYITEIDKNRYKVSSLKLPKSVASKLRKNSKKKSSYASNLEEYFAFDINEYYESIQMGLPALYYSGRNNPQHPEVWVNYFLRMVLLYSNKICELSESSSEDEISGSLSYLKGKEKELLMLLIKKYKREFTPIEVSRDIGVTNKTIINRLSVLVKNGFVEPIMVKQRIRSYELSDFTRDNEKTIKKMLKD